MRYAKNDLIDLTEALNQAIFELGAPIAQADGTLISATNQLNALLAWANSSLPAANGTLTDAFKTFNYFVRGEQLTLMNEVNRVGGNRYTSNQVEIPPGVTSIRLILTSSNWDTAGPGDVEWGVENSQDNGVNWVLMGGSTVPIGYLNKGWLMPTLSLFHLDEVGGLWRIFLFPTDNVRLGVNGRLI